MNIEIRSIKNIKNFVYDFPIQEGIYAIAGENGSGKSTIMNILASTVRPSNVSKLRFPDICQNTYIKLEDNGVMNEWLMNKKESLICTTRSLSNYYNKEGKNIYLQPLKFDGFYEGSVFSGTRFQDIQNFENMFKSINHTHVTDTTNLFRETFSYILHGDKTHYKNLKSLANMQIAKEFDIAARPYFLLVGDNNLIGKYNMSSGECLLVTLLNFIHNTLLETKKKKKVLFFIDEVELALHPAAIVRLVEYLKNLVKEYNITVYFSTHSSDLLKRIDPEKIFYVKNVEGVVNIENPCYPHYAIKNFYEHDGYDSIILVEDRVTQILLKKLIRTFSQINNILVNIVPVGGWRNVLELQEYLIKTNSLGVNKFIFSVIDGDVETEVNKNPNYKNIKKLFLPIQSIEKYLFSKIILNYDIKFAKILSDKYLQLNTIEEVKKKYLSEYTKATNKTFYKYLLNVLDKNSIKEEYFLENIAEDIYKYENINSLSQKIDSFIKDSYSF